MTDCINSSFLINYLLWPRWNIQVFTHTHTHTHTHTDTHTHTHTHTHNVVVFRGKVYLSRHAAASSRALTAIYLLFLSDNVIKKLFLNHRFLVVTNFLLRIRMKFIISERLLCFRVTKFSQASLLGRTAGDFLIIRHWPFFFFLQLWRWWAGITVKGLSKITSMSNV